MQHVTDALGRLTVNRASSNSSVDLEAFSPNVLEAIAAWARKAKEAVRQRIARIQAHQQVARFARQQVEAKRRQRQITKKRRA